MNNDFKTKSFKYSTEATIGYYLGKFQMAQQDDFEDILKNNFFDDENLCNIYFICQRPKITIDPNSFSFDNDFIRLKFDIHSKNDKIPVTFVRSNFTPVSKLQFNTSYPFRSFEITDENNILLIGGKVNHFVDQFFNKNELNELLDYEILYIGKSDRKEKTNSPIDRLVSHKTLQKIYFEQSTKEPDKEIFCLLCNFKAQGYINMYGGDNYESEIDAEIERASEFNQIMKGIESRSMLSLVEAGLINYFKPKFNKHFKEYFIEKKHDSYKFFMKKDFNGMALELDLQDLNSKVYSNQNKRNIYYYKLFHFVKSNDRIKMFTDEY